MTVANWAESLVDTRRRPKRLSLDVEKWSQTTDLRMTQRPLTLTAAEDAVHRGQRGGLSTAAVVQVPSEAGLETGAWLRRHRAQDLRRTASNRLPAACVLALRKNAFGTTLLEGDSGLVFRDLKVL